MIEKKPLLICDWDCTLAEPIKRSFYAQNRHKTELAIANQYGLSQERLAEITAALDGEKIRIEKLFSSKSLADRFNLSSMQLGQYQHLTDALNSINPKSWFKPDDDVVQSLRALKSSTTIVVLSNSPEGLIRAIGKEIGFDMDEDFEEIYALNPQKGPPKFVDAYDAFQTIIKNHNPDMSKSWSLGDSVHTDLEPAAQLGLNTALVDNLGLHQNNNSFTLSGPIHHVLKKIALAL